MTAVHKAPSDYPSGKQADVCGGEAKRAFEAMTTMKKTDAAAIEAARRG